MTRSTNAQSKKWQAAIKATTPKLLDNRATAALTQIRSERVRNLVRGALMPDTPEAFRATMERLHRECDRRDAAVVAAILGGSLLARYKLVGDTFPPDGAAGADAPFFDGNNLHIELETQKCRLASEGHRLVEAIERIAAINELLLCDDRVNADQAICSFTAEFGASIMMAHKVISARNAGQEKNRTFGNPAVVPFWSPKRSVLAAALEDTADQERSYLHARRSFINFARRDDLDSHEASIIVDILSPAMTEGFSYARRLHAFGRRAAIDTVSFIFRLEQVLRTHGSVVEADQVLDTIPNDVITAWRNAFGKLEPARLQDFVGREDQFDDLRLFAHLPAWSEYSNLLDHRIAVENAFGDRLDGRLLSKQRAANFAAPCDEVKELLEKVPSGPAQMSGDGFHRTIALVASATNGQLRIAGGEELGKLLDCTIDVPHLLSVAEIERLLPPKRSDLLYEYYRLVLLHDADQNSTRNHAMRRALQKLLREHHNGDVLSFMRSIDSERGHLSDHLYDLLSETFLTSLYEIYAHADDVLEAQTRLLEWQASRHNDADALTRARSHRLLIRLRRVRGTIESTRIYVDPLRFFEWLADEVSDELKALAPFAEDILADEDRSTNLTDVVRNAVQPRAKLLQLIDDAYREFCTNRVHGAVSFIARRIRHGTFHGHLSVEIAPIVEQAAAQFTETAPDFSAYLRHWMRQFDAAVLALATDRMHIRTKDKPRGLIASTISDPDKSTIANAVVLRVATALRETTQLVTPLAIILDDCWLLLEVDLRRSREAVERLRSDFVIDVGQRFATGRSETDTRMSQTILELNGIVDQRFETAKSWLTRPTNFSPSASVSLLVNAVIDEVSQRYQFQPVIDIPDGADIDLIGHRFHLVYDALFVLVVNAAKYGRCGGHTKIAARRDEEDDRFITLVIEIASEMDPAKREHRVRQIEAEMTADVDDAMDIDQQSGLRKVRCIVAEVDEVVDFDWKMSGDTVSFSLSLRYLRS